MTPSLRAEIVRMGESKKHRALEDVRRHRCTDEPAIAGGAYEEWTLPSLAEVTRWRDSDPASIPDPEEWP